VTHAHRAKINYFCIIVMIGHKTLRAFQRDNLNDEGEPQEAMTTLHAYLTHHEMDTSMNTTPSEVRMPRRKNAVNPRS
jgi:hypothetical protein